MKKSIVFSVISCGLMVASPAFADMSAFHPGSVITDFGKVATVQDPRLGADTHFKVAYDVSEAAPEGEVSRYLVTPARFLNMHVEAGVPEENIELAIVIHGPAVVDLLNAEARGEANPSADLIAELLAHGMSIQLCGQTAAARDISEEDLLPGVTIALSAMTAHALLQQEGYTLNPF